MKSVFASSIGTKDFAARNGRMPFLQAYSAPADRLTEVMTRRPAPAVTLETLIYANRLQREPAGAAEIRRFLDKIANQAERCKSQPDQPGHPLRYRLRALLQIGLVALRANGLRVGRAAGHHLLALQTLNKSIGYPQDRLRLLDEFRQQRAAVLRRVIRPQRGAEVEAILTPWLTSSNTSNNGCRRSIRSWI